MSSAKWRPFCLGLNVFKLLPHIPGSRKRNSPTLHPTALSPLRTKEQHCGKGHHGNSPSWVRWPRWITAGARICVLPWSRLSLVITPSGSVCLPWEEKGTFGRHLLSDYNTTWSCVPSVVVILGPVLQHRPQEFQPMAAQLSMKAALPFAKIVATVPCRSRNTGSRCPDRSL